MPLATVITADIVQSSKLTKKQFNALIKAFQSLMQPHAHEFYRGDSF